VLTPRRVALAAAEALAEGLLGLPVKEDELAKVLAVARCRAVSKTKISASASLSHTSVLGGGRHLELSLSASV
jgi:hypothetical protein